MVPVVVEASRRVGRENDREIVCGTRRSAGGGTRRSAGGVGGERRSASVVAVSAGARVVLVLVLLLCGCVTSRVQAATAVPARRGVSRVSLVQRGLVDDL